MHPVRTLIVLALVPCLAGPARAVVTGASTAKKGQHLARGQVIAVQVDAAKGSGTVTISVHRHHKKSSTTDRVSEKTFEISAGTKVEIVTGKKGAVQQQPADISALQKGEHVVIYHSGTAATDVKIIKKGKGKVAKKNV
jgi:hypothetical protein